MEAKQFPSQVHMSDSARYAADTAALKQATLVDDFPPDARPLIEGVDYSFNRETGVLTALREISAEGHAVAKLLGSGEVNWAEVTKGINSSKKLRKLFAASQGLHLRDVYKSATKSAQALTKAANKRHAKTKAAAKAKSAQRKKAKGK